MKSAVNLVVSQPQYLE